MTKYKASYSGIGEMLCAPWMEADMLRRAENVKAMAEELAPVDKQRRPPQKGEEPKPIYALSFKATSGIKTTVSEPGPGAKKGKTTKRAYGRVTNDAPHARIVEFGWGRTPRYATLRNALHLVAGD